MSLSLSATAAAHGDAPALIFDDRELTWAQLARRVVETASSIALGAGPVMLEPVRDEASIVTILAAIQAGVPLCLLSPRAAPGQRAAQQALARSDARGEPPLAYVFTSGSTGAPRAARLPRRAFVASARASAALLPLRPGDRWLLSMPLSHVGGLSIVTRALHGGAAIVVSPEERWDARGAVARMDRQRVTHASFVPTMLTRVLRAELAAPEALRAVLVGGAPAPASLLSRARDVGWPVLPTYGLTESCSQVATRRPGDIDDHEHRIGAPLPGGALVRIVESEIQVSGPTLFDGYVGHPDPLTTDGWFPTGDLGSLDADGVLSVRGRQGDLIITGGENVHPSEVEAVLVEHPAISEACVFGVPDAEWGEIVGAAIVSSAGAAAVEAWLSERCAPHHRPRQLFFVDALPKSPVGKIDRAMARRAALPSEG